MPKRTQSSQSSAGPSSQKRSRPSEVESVEEITAGKLLHISLKNFMCHANFKLDFNPRMNFILGHNGSGKSCILTAIIIGLGGSAKATNRSNNMGKLVKTGEPSATIEIHLSNVGVGAFEPETYGRRIIVTRTIREKGGGGYKILNEKKEVMSTAKNKLDVILRYFEITVNNPITVLTQDCARTFLRDSDARARFKLFKQGSGLETIEEELRTCIELQGTIEMQLKRRKDKSKYFRGEFKEKMRVYEMLESAEKAKERTEKLEKELKWVAIQKEERAMEECDKELQRHTAKLQKFTNEVAGFGNEQQELEKFIESLSAETARVEATRDTHSAEITAQKSALQEKKNEFFSVRKKFVSIEGRVKQMRLDIRSIDESLSELTQQESREEHEREVAELQRQLQATEAEVREKSENMQTTQGQVDEMEKKLDTLQHTCKNLARDVAHWREQLLQLRDETDSLAVYGAHMPQFVKAIDRNRTCFSQVPLGPIGRYLEVADSKYKPVIEQLVSGQLGSFIVNTPKDNMEFQRLFAKEFPGRRCPNVIQRTFRNQPYDTALHGVQVPRHATSPLQQMRCNNTVVLNTIIDMVRIEQVLICENMAQGRKLTENLENVPRNLKKVMVMEPFCEVYPQPNFRIYSLRKQCKYIQVSAAEKKGQLQQTFDEVNGKLEEAKGMRVYTENMTLQMKQTRKKLHVELQGLDKKKRDTNRRIADITEQHLGPRIEEDTLLEEKQRLEAKLEEMSGDYEPQKNALDALKSDMDAMAAEIQQTEEMSHQFEAKLGEARERVNKMRDKRERLVMARTDKAGMLRDMEQRVSNQRKASEEKQQKVNGMMAEAGERIRTRKTVEEIREQISILRAQREVSTQITQTREEIMEELGVLEAKVAELDAEVELGVKTLNAQKDAVLKHKRQYDTKRVVVQQRMAERFRSLLAQQSYHGDLKIDYTNSTLELEINPRSSGTVQGTKSLSGGERSFSTVAFLLSIWCCIDHPFFLLDEYDVFTDGSNRELMTRMLVKEAMEKPQCQYMFLTPQDVAHLIKPSAELGVFKMPDKK